MADRCSQSRIHSPGLEGSWLTDGISSWIVPMTTGPDDRSGRITRTRPAHKGRAAGFGEVLPSTRVDLHPLIAGLLGKKEFPRRDLGNDDLPGDDPGLEILDGGDEVVDEPAAGGIAEALIGQPEHSRSRTELV
jgi:hypothetical protein